jgi:hypothetical protein
MNGLPEENLLFPYAYVDGSSLASTDTPFAYPFRLRNPARFNIRDFPLCALHSYPNILQLSLSRLLVLRLQKLTDKTQTTH